MPENEYSSKVIITDTGDNNGDKDISPLEKTAEILE